jgi:GNAT superfamily N-acetyltransferase
LITKDERLSIRLIEPARMETIIPLVEMLNPGMSTELIRARMAEMIPQGYQCVGIYDGDALIGISGIWLQTHFYCGKWIEPDNVFIHPDHQGRGIGKKLMAWIYEYGREQGCDTTELNAYTTNSAGQKFWMNEGYRILGFHFQKKLK